MTVLPQAVAAQRHHREDIMKFTPTFDPAFRPLSVVFKEYKKDVLATDHKPLVLCVERNNGYNYRFEYPIYAAPEKADENCRLAERIVKTLLWLVGGYKVYVGGDEAVYAHIKAAYTMTGTRAFDTDFMQKMYEHPFEVVLCAPEEVPSFKPCSLSVGGHLDGCRIGFDAGGSDRKVSAVVDGEVIFSEEVVWFPKLQSDPDYHYAGILDAMKTAASKMPRVDAIGVSSAGDFVNNRVMVSSLFIKVPDELYESKVRNIYIDVAREIGPDIPLEVANDGDVTALAGAIGLGDNRVLGIAMGTSEAVGYINDKGGLNGWLSELAFAPMDFNPDAAVDEWSGDYGCGCKYFSQDSVIKLAEAGGFRFEENLSPAEKLKVIQKMMAEGDPFARTIYEDIGIYLGYALAYYALFYDIGHVLLLGRVTSGKGGDLIMEKAREVLAAEFPECHFDIGMPDEKTRRVGQSIAAASLAATRK